MFGLPNYRWLPAGLLLLAFPSPSQGQVEPPLQQAHAVAVRSAINAAAPVSTSSSSPVQLPHLSAEQIGDLDELRGHYQRAIEAYSQVTPRTPAVLNKTGIAYQMMFALKDAALYYKKSLKLDPKSSMALNNLGTIDDELKDFSSAERMYRKAIKADPGNALVLKNLGTNLLVQGKYDEGWDAYKQALAINPHVFEDNIGPKTDDPIPARTRGIANYYKARSCARAGLAGCAIAYLRLALHEGFASSSKIDIDSDFAPLRANPEFQQLLVGQ